MLGAFSIANVFNSVIANYNDRLYWTVSNNVADNTIHAGVNDRFYWVYDTGTVHSWVITTLPAGTYTAAHMGVLLAMRINNVIADLVMVYGPPECASIVLVWTSPVTSLYLPSHWGHYGPRVAAAGVARSSVLPPRQPKRGLHRELDAGLAEEVGDRDSRAQRRCGLELVQHHRSG